MNVLVTESVVVGEGSTHCPLSDALHLRLQFSVRTAVTRPVWTLTYIADIASERVDSELACSSSTDAFLTLTPSANEAEPGEATLLPNVAYELMVSLPETVMRQKLAEGIALKYLLQIGTFTFALRGHVDGAAGPSPVTVLVNVPCQVRRAADGALVRTILQ